MPVRWAPGRKASSQQAQSLTPSQGIPSSAAVIPHQHYAEEDGWNLYWNFSSPSLDTYGLLC